MAKLLFTGFPGFLGSALLPRLLWRFDGTAVCLVQPKFAELARRRLGGIFAAYPKLGRRIELAEGDITEPGLGLDGSGELRGEIGEIFHLAAIYDLSVEREPAMRVNVEGTRHILDFAAECPALLRFHYMSTCYVSGDFDGTFSEDDLDRGQSFVNRYEESKYLAEVEVQARIGGGLPATIYRPAIVVGDSDSGATQKYDGPYYIIRWILKQPRLALMPTIGDPAALYVNIVPRDFVVNAIAHLSRLPHSNGVVYQLADPEPLSAAEIIEAVARTTGQRVLRVRLPLKLAKAATDHVPGVYRLTGIPSSTLDYFVKATRYSSENTQRDLGGSGIRVPPLPSYLDRLIDFVRRNPTLGSEAMA